MAATKRVGAGGRQSALDTASDNALLAAHVEGHPEAFNELVRRHRDRLWAVALRTTRNPEDAADAVQEALISA
ncbi:MAG: RNA polymerase sigma factor SigM, partial [Actinomycetota bacterium]|nr:RNA polymerase sigma factor SigM [Actinomycetota bacterium]